MVVRRALGISAISQAVTFVLGFANVVIVSRLLKPEEIGIFSVAVSVLGLAHILREFGVGNYLVQAAKVSPLQFRAAFTVALISSWLIALLLFLGRMPMARWYSHDGIAEVLLLLALNFLILPLGTPVMAMLQRDLQFGRLATLSILGATVQTGVTIGAALAGQSYLSMAWGSIAMTLSKVLIVNIMRPGQTFILPTLSGLHEVVRFGSLTSLAAIVKQLGTAAPDLILGRTLGFAEVAIFSRGVGLYRMVTDRLIALVHGVFFASFAADLRKGADGAALYARATNYLLSLMAPTLAVLAILSQPLILFVFGPQWERSVPIAAIVCAASILTAPYALYTRALVAAGHVVPYMWAEITTQTARVLVLVTSIWLPLERVVILLPLAYLVEAVIAQFALKRALGLDGLMLLKQVWRAVVLVPCAALGPALLILASWHFGFEQHRLAILVSASALALGGWLAGVFLLGHPMRNELQRLWSRVWPR